MSDCSERTEHVGAAVIGASSSGLYTACLLAEAGHPVTVYEAAKSLDPKPRTLIVTSKMRELLGQVGDESVVGQINKFELYANGRAATVGLEHADLIIDRSRLIRSLARLAKARGAQIRLDHRFKGLESNGRGLRLHLETGRNGTRTTHHKEAGALVGADGTFSSVARSAGWPEQPSIPLVQALVDLPGDFDCSTSKVWFVPEDTPYFYWLIPESSGRGALGVIGEDPRRTREGLERFLVKQGLEPLEFQAARIPRYQKWIPVRRAVERGSVYLVGDAAGQVKVSTVGGIVTGLRGAIGVAEAITRAGPSTELRDLRRELDRHLLIRRALHQFRESDYDRLLRMLNEPALRALCRTNRDDAGALLRRVLRGQPRLVALGLRCVLSDPGLIRLVGF